MKYRAWPRLALAVLFVGMLLPDLAAARCERQVRTLDRSLGAAVIEAWRGLSACDAAQATDRLPAALKQVDTVDHIAGLALAAIDSGVSQPVYGVLESIGDYAQREEVARAIGSPCKNDPEVLAFVRSLHSAVKDRAYVAWSPAVAACNVQAVSDDLRAQVVEPPSNRFDNKYARVAELYAERFGVDALPALRDAAIRAAGNGGPVPSILDAMSRSVRRSGVGAKVEGTDGKALADALLGVAAGVGDAEVGRVADALVSNGLEDAAAKLLPRLHPGMQQPDGTFLYSMAAVEACNGRAVVHWAVVQDSGQRWSVDDAAAEAAGGFKRGLKACEGPLTTSVSSAPIPRAGDAEAFARTVADTVEADKLKLKAEKRVVLP